MPTAGILISTVQVRLKPIEQSSSGQKGCSQIIDLAIVFKRAVVNAQRQLNRLWVFGSAWCPSHPPTAIACDDDRRCGSTSLAWSKLCCRLHLV